MFNRLLFLMYNKIFNLTILDKKNNYNITSAVSKIVY